MRFDVRIGAVHDGPEQLHELQHVRQVSKWLERIDSLWRRRHINWTSN